MVLRKPNQRIELGKVRVTRVADSLPSSSPSWEGAALQAPGKNTGHVEMLLRQHHKEENREICMMAKME